MSGDAFSGVWLVARSGRVFQRTAGLADRAGGQEWRTDTRSQVASISKQFVAACALVLVDRGSLRLDDPVPRHLPCAGPEWDEVSVYNLLTHTSGMSHWSEAPGFSPADPLPATQRLRLLLAASRPRRSGERFHYSSPGYIVLAAVISAAAGQPYEQFVRETVISPLRLAETHIGSPGQAPKALGYRNGEFVEPWDLASMPGTGDMWSTAGDLARFVRALHMGGLLPRAVQPLLHQVRVPYEDSSESRIRAHAYGAGHFQGTVDGRNAYLHPGDNPGYLSLALWLPDTSTVAVVLTNEESVDIEALALTALSETVD